MKETASQPAAVYRLMTASQVFPRDADMPKNLQDPDLHFLSHHQAQARHVGGFLLGLPSPPTTITTTPTAGGMFPPPF